MNIKILIPFLLLLVGCGSRPDSSGKVYEIDLLQAKKELYQQLNEIIEDDDEHHEAYYRRSKLYYEDDKLSPALVDIKKALKLEPQNQSYLTQQAEIYAALNEYDKAYRVLAKTDDANKTTELQKLELIAGVKTGKITDATSIATIMKGLKLEQGREDYLLGMLAWDKKDTLQTKLKLESAYNKGEKGEDVLLTLIKTYQADSLQRKALNLLLEAATTFESKHSRILLANYYIRHQMYLKEDSVYDVMLKDKPLSSEVVMRKSRLYQSQRRNSDLIDLLSDKYIKTKTKEDDRILADAYFELRKNNEALEIYNTLEALDTTGTVKKNLNVIRWRKEQEKRKNLPDSVRTIAKDSVNSTP